MNPTTAEAIIRIDEQVKTATGAFHHSASATTVYDPSLGHVFGELDLTVADVLLVAILSQVHVLVTGPTGRGKTALVELVCQGAFGSDGWFLLRLNPHLNEETFANISMPKLKKGSLREAISPAPFLTLPCTVLDECNRTPAALTNILLGFCDGRIELKCGLKCDVGYDASNSNTMDQRYHLVIGTMNIGDEYKGTFDIDPALSSRFTLTVPFGDLPVTPHDLVEIVRGRIGHAERIPFGTTIDSLASASQAILQLPLDPLALVYLVYLGNVGRCAHSETGWKSVPQSQEICNKSECRIRKKANGFCPSVGGLNERLLIFLKRAACGLAALRAARTVRAIRQACEVKAGKTLDSLRKYAATAESGVVLGDAVIDKYLQEVCVTAADIKAMLSFVVLGGKVHLAQQYVTRHFDGSFWLAGQHYAQETYEWLESFIRQNHRAFQNLTDGNGAIDKLQRLLEHAERFTDPYVAPTIYPFLTRLGFATRSPSEVASEIDVTAPIRGAAGQLLRD